jgi:catechol 2,3-dioxygenase-like lactoylglutathione lyase family enzyme
MSKPVDQLLDDYESGRISRRNFLTTVTAMAALGSSRLGAEAKPELEVTSINHVTLFVKDIPKAVDFYRDLFGLEIKSQQPNGINLSTGQDGQFLGFYGGTADTPEQIHHICLGIKNFDAEKAVKILAGRGITAQIRMRGETPELYFPDPNGFMIQLQDDSYCGGAGVLGNMCKS